MKKKQIKYDFISNDSIRLIQPLQMIWNPKEDITTYELAICLTYIFRPYSVMPNEVDLSHPHFRHFDIINPNQ